MSGSKPGWLTCASCGARGRAPTIRLDDKRPPDEVVVTPVFNYGSPPRTVLLCAACKWEWERLRQRRSRP
jgi:hypothetical protein